MVKTMAPEDRDRSFDKAIARHLRSAAASSDSATNAAGTPLQREACPDTETLAAYHERSLLPEELNSCKEHIVACAHCQELLAQLELTDGIPLHAAEEVEVFAMADAQHTPAMQKIETLPRPATVPEIRRASRIPSGVRWRWLAPAGAIAAGLLVWIAMHEQKPTFPSAPEIKEAKNQEPAAPPLSDTADLPAAAAPSPQQTPPKSGYKADEMTSSTARAELSREQRQVAELKRKTALAKPSVDEESRLRKDAPRDANAYLYRNEKKADLDDKAVAGALKQKALEQKKESETQANAPAPVPAQEQNLQAQNQNISPKVSGPAPLGQTKNLAKSKVATPPDPPPAPAADAVSSYAAGATTEMVMVSDSRLIVAPGSTFVWRPGRAGLIEFSTNGGRSWIRQSSGVAVDLLTGSALSDKVCWIVGRVGAILLTTDGGEHWKLLSSPLKEDLGGIRATDALHAMIWNARSTKYFATSDGGLTWQSAVHP
jgi:hypothetical protein